MFRLAYFRTEIQIRVENAMSRFKSTNILAMAKRLLSTQGIPHYLCTRFGSQRLRGWAFDQKYSKEFSEYFDETHSPESPTVKFIFYDAMLDHSVPPDYLLSPLPVLFSSEA